MSVRVEINKVNKKFEQVEALKDISLNVEEGELFGLIGPDGAGKTTLFRLITNLLIQDSGNIRVGNYDSNKDFREIRKITGYMPGRFSLYHDLTVEENLNFYAHIFKTTLKENYHLIKDVYSQIEPFKKRKAGDLSGGMKQKLALSCALIHKPDLLILDEPTTGVDAVSRKEFWELLKKMQKTGITIMVSTPYMDEASLCDRVALMQKGKLLALETPQNIVNQYNGDLWKLSTSNMHRIIIDMEDVGNGIKNVFRFGEKVHITSEGLDLKKVETIVNEHLSPKGHKNIIVESTKPQIEDCFLDLMDEN